MAKIVRANNDHRALFARARESLRDYALLVTGGQWRPSRFHLFLCVLLEEVEKGNIRRVIINVPPRHGKSELVTRIFPAWFLGRHPNNSIIIAAHTAELAYELSRHCRNYFSSVSYPVFGIKLSREARRTSRWSLNIPYRGTVIAAGVEGPITGHGASLAILDDPIKNIQEARSRAYRDHLWDWYRSTFRTRLSPMGRIVIVMTRWHPDDLVGRLLREAEAGGEQWFHLKLPALAEEDDPLGRVPGEPLWPEMFSKETLIETRRSLGWALFQTMYQQEPVDISGQALWTPEVLDKTRCAPPEELDRIVVAIDPAGTGAASSDETGIIVAGVKGEGLSAEAWVLADASGHYAPLEWARKAVELYEAFSADTIVVETNYGGDMVEVTLRAIAPNVPVKKISASRGKILRAEPVAALYEAGRVHHAKVFPELERQMVTYTGHGDSPDRLDALVYAITELCLSGGTRRDRTVDVLSRVLGR